jgi:pimeloyl-ACP methyl ester carboxylesterase
MKRLHLAMISRLWDLARITVAYGVIEVRVPVNSWYQAPSPNESGDPVTPFCPALYNSRMLVLRALLHSSMLVLRALLLAFALTKLVVAQQTISIPTEDGGRVCADLYGQGPRAVVLAHGGRFNKESWREQARILVSDQFRILALDFRGFGCSTGPGQTDFDNAPFENDVLAAVRYLKGHGAQMVSVVGGSFGGGAAGDASIKSKPGEIDRIVFLGAAPNLSAERLKSRTLFIVARDDSNGAGPSAEGTDRSGRCRARSVPFPDRPKRSRHARDPAIPLDALIIYVPTLAAIRRKTGSEGPIMST